MNILAIIIVIFLLLVLLWFLFRNKQTPKVSTNAITLDKNFVQSKWLEIERTFNLGGPSHFKTSIIEADKLLDYVLKSRGVRGNNLGERLKNAKPKFSNYTDYDNLWFAHKVRNSIAHESMHDLNSAEAKRAIEYFKKALRTLGVL